MKKILLIVASIAVVFALAACDNNKPVEQNTESSKNESVVTNNTSNKTAETNNNEVNENNEVDKADASSLKNDEDKANYEIQIAMQKFISEAYGDDVMDVYTVVEKIYSADEEQEIEALKEYNLGPNEVAFEVSYSLNPAEGADIQKLTATDGEYEKETGRIVDKHGLGILRPDGDSYKITNFGTGW